MLPLGDEPPDPCAADGVLLVLVAAEPLVAGPAAGAVEPLQGQHRFDADVGDLLEDAVGGVGVVVLPDAGVVPPEHVVGAAEVLADEGVEDGLPGPGVAHVPQQDRRLVHVGQEVARLPQHVLAEDHGLVDRVAHLLLADDGADQHAVGPRGEPGRLHQPLVADVGHVAGLVGDDLVPAELLERRPHLGRREEEPVERLRQPGRVHQRDRPADEPVLVGERAPHAGVGVLGGAVDLGGQERLVVVVDLLHVERGQRPALVGEDDRLSFGDALVGDLLR